jgi:hypothetical protein
MKWLVVLVCALALVAADEEKDRQAIDHYNGTQEHSAELDHVLQTATVLITHMKLCLDLHKELLQFSHAILHDFQEVYDEQESLARNQTEAACCFSECKLTLEQLEVLKQERAHRLQEFHDRLHKLRQQPWLSE